VNIIHRRVDEPGHRSCSKENESKVGTNVSELLGGEDGISDLASDLAPATGLSSHRSSTNSQRSPGGSILSRRVPYSRDGAGAKEGETREGSDGFSA
jgi:hypothetical protein